MIPKQTLRQKIGSRIKARIPAERLRARTERIRAKAKHVRTRIRAGIQTKVTRIKQNRPIKKLPTILTFVNAILGFIALISVYNEQYLIASLLIMAAFIFDILDGFMARFLEVTSTFGVELDSLADAVTFVLAPAMLIYFRFFQTPRIGLVVATFAVICGIARLAKFNTTTDTSSFIGMPTPFFAAMTIALVFLDIRLHEEAAALLFFILALLMISPVKYPNFKEEATKKYRMRAVIGLAAFGIIIFLPISMAVKAIAVNVLFWLFLLLPFCLDRAAIRRRKFVAAFGGGLLLATIAFYENPQFLLMLPAIYSVIAAPLIQAAMMERRMM